MFLRDFSEDDTMSEHSGLIRSVSSTQTDNYEYKHVKPLNFLNKPKYSAIERSSDDNEKITTNLIDASRFDYEERVDDFKLKRKYSDERLLTYLGLDKADIRNIKIQIPNRNLAKIFSKKPKKKIIIRRFKKSSTRISKKGLQRRRETGRTPAEKLYLKMKSQLAFPARQIKLTARSINDNLKDESKNPYYHQTLHHDHLQEEIAREATRFTASNYVEPKKVQFQIHGQGGPNSYRFGHDTGIG